MVEHIALCCNAGRGRDSRASGRGALILIFTVLKHGKQWDSWPGFLALMKLFLRNLSSYFCTVLERMYEVCAHCRETNGRCSAASRIGSYFGTSATLATPQILLFCRAADQVAV